MNKSLKIFHLLSQRPDSTGSGIFIQAMLQAAERKGHFNSLLAGIQSDRPAALECFPEEKCSFVRFGEDIPFGIVGMSDVMPYRSVRFCDLTEEKLLEYHEGFEGKLKQAVETFKPDIIHSHHLWLLSSLTRRLFPEVPMVTTCHGSDLRQFQSCSHLRPTVLNGCAKIDAVMALSRAQKQEIMRLYRLPGENIHVTGAGYNDRLFIPGIKPDPDPVRLVYAGKLSHAKGVPWLLKVLEKIDAPAWQIHLVGSGSGEEKENCLKAAARLGKKVHIHGAVTQQELAAVMRQSHVFVLPSFYEGLPLVLLEALASGCRIIATDLPGVVELLGTIRSDGIHLVKTPRLHSIDRPVAADEKTFEKELEKAVRKQMTAAISQPQFDISTIRDTIAGMAWPGVFEKVERVYFETIRRFRANLPD